MQYVNEPGEIRHIDCPKSSRSIANANFPDTGTDGRKWLPIVRIDAPLHLVWLVSDSTPSHFRKSAKVIQTASAKPERLGLVHSAFIQYLV